MYWFSLRENHGGCCKICNLFLQFSDFQEEARTFPLLLQEYNGGISGRRIKKWLHVTRAHNSPPFSGSLLQQPSNCLYIILRYICLVYCKRWYIQLIIFSFVCICIYIQPGRCSLIIIHRSTPQKPHFSHCFDNILTSIASIVAEERNSDIWSTKLKCWNTHLLCLDFVYEFAKQ